MARADVLRHRPLVRLLLNRVLQGEEKPSSQSDNARKGGSGFALLWLMRSLSHRSAATALSPADHGAPGPSAVRLLSVCCPSAVRLRRLRQRCSEAAVRLESS